MCQTIYPKLKRCLSSWNQSLSDHVSDALCAYAVLRVAALTIDQAFAAFGHSHVPGAHEYLTGGRKERQPIAGYQKSRSPQDAKVFSKSFHLDAVGTQYLRRPSHRNDGLDETASQATIYVTGHVQNMQRDLKQ